MELVETPDILEISARAIFCDAVSLADAFSLRDSSRPDPAKLFTCFPITCDNTICCIIWNDPLFHFVSCLPPAKMAVLPGMTQYCVQGKGNTVIQAAKYLKRVAR